VFFVDRGLLMGAINPSIKPVEIIANKKQIYSIYLDSALQSNFKLRGGKPEAIK
jgi:hypothetical protein